MLIWLHPYLHLWPKYMFLWPNSAKRTCICNLSTCTTSLIGCSALLQMTLPNERMMEELKSLAQCSICLDKCKSPRTLPCIHTFCLQCLEHLTQLKQPREKVPCPLCKQLFTIPKDGIASLPRNPLVSRILDLGNITGPQEKKEVKEERRRNFAFASRCSQVHSGVGEADDQCSDKTRNHEFHRQESQGPQIPVGQPDSPEAGENENARRRGPCDAKSHGKSFQLQELLAR